VATPSEHGRQDREAEVITRALAGEGADDALEDRDRLLKFPRNR
jgi:hypothetical protein